MATNQGVPAKAGISSATAAAKDRKERRLPIAVRVKVFPDVESPDSQTCVTYEISTFGARLVAPSGVRVEGQIVYLQRHSRRAKYKVIWIGKPGTKHADQVGVECMEPNNVIWEQDIRTRLQQAAFVEDE
ncbi:MAG TPA: PilZ domain-containing protein [Candidatus Angelobacter sp.]|nr:PilZ domain-containing protein [Candidatus Angelobacter sp.]